MNRVCAVPHHGALSSAWRDSCHRCRRSVALASALGINHVGQVAQQRQEARLVLSKLRTGLTGAATRKLAWR